MFHHNKVQLIYIGIQKCPAPPPKKKITRHAKKQNKTKNTHNEKEKLTQMLEYVEKDTETVIITIFQTVTITK